MLHCSDNKADRSIGAIWERHFCELAARHGLMFSPLQLAKQGAAVAYWRKEKRWHSLTLPDVTIWTAPGQHHEIKHKEPTKYGQFGLEVYRFDALLSFAETTGQKVYYTIHNHALAGGREVTVNRLEHWITAEVRALDHKWARKAENGVSWVNGIRRDNVPIYYWPAELWKPLASLWTLATEAA